MHGMNTGWRSVRDADAAESDVARDAQARRGTDTLRGARRIVGATEEGDHVHLDLPGVRHANFDAAHQHTHGQDCAFRGEASLSQVELDATRGDAELAARPSL